MSDALDWTPDLRRRLARLRLDPAREAEIIEELSQHLDERYQELRSGGATPADAQRLAVEELLDSESLATRMRSLRQANVPAPVVPGAPRRLTPAGLWADLRYAIRMLTKERGFTAAAVLTLALGIGANSAIFALVDATLLRPLPFPAPERLVQLWERTERTARGSVSPLNLIDWNERNRTFEAIGAFVPNVGGMVLGGADGTAETIPRQWVTARMFHALGVQAIVGRTFLPSDDTEGRSVIVVSEAFWRTRFNADPGVVGRDLRLDGEPWTIVGVVPEEAQVIGRTSIWALRRIHGAPPPVRGVYAFHAIGRMKAGVTRDAAAADLAAVAKGLAREYPTTNQGRGVALEPLHDAVIGSELRRTSLLFLGVVAFVLLICCANVANLLLTRATVRRRELAIRSALGADRKRIVRQLLTESLLLAGVGGAVGLAVGAFMLEIAPLVIPQGLLPGAVTLAFDWRVVAFSAAATLLVGVVFGLAPAWQATDLAPAQALGSGSRTATRRGGRLRELLVVAEVATAMLLLVGAGLLLRTLLAIQGVDRGYGADNVLTMIVDPPGPERVPWLPFYEAAEREVLALPGVRSVAWATTLPMGRSYQGRSSFEIVGDPAPRESQRPTADYQIVSPPYFQTVDLAVIAGRVFNERDTADGVPVCIVNEAFVRAHLHGRSPIGLRVAVPAQNQASAPPVAREIVGVARQVKGRPDEAEDLLQVYVPLAQDTPGDIFMLVRPASGRAGALAPSVRAAIARVDREQLVSVRSVLTLEAVASEATARHRFRAILVIAFAALALFLAMVGLFGILAYAVQQREREFGVRRALGATSQDVLRLVLRGALRVIAVGAVIGLAFSVVLSQSLAAMLFGVQPLDPVTFVSVTMVLALTAVLAASGPAWRATRIHPVIALRAE